MRFATSVVLALPLLAAAESPFEQYKAQFQNFLGSIGSFIPGAAQEKAAEPAAADQSSATKPKAAVVEPKISVLTLDNWKDTLYAPVKAGATKPEEWWVFISGGNKTCYGMYSTHSQSPPPFSRSHSDHPLPGST